MRNQQSNEKINEIKNIVSSKLHKKINNKSHLTLNLKQKFKIVPKSFNKTREKSKKIVMQSHKN